MDFNLTTEQQALRDQARSFAVKELTSIGREIEQTNEPLSRDWKKRLGEMGFLGINISPELGGVGLSSLDAVIVLEEFAKIHPAVAFPIFESCVGPTKAIERFGQDSLKRRIIPEVCRGERVVAVAMSEPDAGTALTDLKTRGTIEGDNILLDGVKRWSSGGGHADGYLVYCRLSEAAGAAGVGAVYVDKTTAGLSFGARELLMGFRGIYSADIFFDKVRLPLEYLV
ncbi:MAG: acyl-CoA dehydrogenase family protein, partial [Beijerinckiaceae bacterium]